LPANHPLEIICHRGANEYAPENTYASAQICLDWGMDYIEVDVNTSKDGVLYVFHGPGLSRTTNGSGFITHRLAAEIDQLDAGSWFDPRFAGESVPRLEPFLRWLKGQAKVFFDVKRANLAQLIDLVYHLEFEHDCFFWFERGSDALEFRRLAPELALKINVSKVADVVKAAEVYRANIVEVELPDMSRDLVTACRDRRLKIMIHHKKNDPAAFRQILAWEADIANVDHGDVLARMMATR
jgi:glycerophosphoryl diester phosphodiesterase